MPESVQIPLFLSLLVLEIMVIKFFSEYPKPSLLKVTASLVLATVLSGLTLLLVKFTIKTFWFITLPSKPSWLTLEILLVWFTGLTLANAAELASLKHLSKIKINTPIALIISLSNIWTAYTTLVTDFKQQ